MDQGRFDRLAVAVAHGASRRLLFRLVAAAWAAALAAAWRTGDGVARVERARPNRRPATKRGDRRPEAAEGGRDAGSGSCAARCRRKPQKAARRRCRKRCHPPSPGCSDRRPCPPGEVCEDGACLPPGDQCATDADCDPCERCADGACAGRCAPSEVCRDGACAAPAACDGPCGPCERCVDGRCRSRCRSGQRCRGGRCVGGGSCRRATCEKLGRRCGAAPDGCGGMLDCGGCPDGSECDGGDCCVPCGSECCPPDETCFPEFCDGWDCYPVCCPGERLCGGGCCLPGETCIPEVCDGEDCFSAFCCRDEQVCGDGRVCCFPNQICADDACVGGEHCTPGEACPAGQTCVTDCVHLSPFCEDYCCPDERLCGEGPQCCWSGDTCTRDGCCAADGLCGDDRCCPDGTSCEDDRCCVVPGYPCAGDADCCEGLSCLDGVCCTVARACAGVCCFADGVCAGGVCCDGEGNTICGDDCCREFFECTADGCCGGRNAACAGDGDCCAGLGCFNGICCTADKTCMQCGRSDDPVCCDEASTCIDDSCCPPECTCGADLDVCCLCGPGGSQECVAGACCNIDRVCGPDRDVCCPDGATCCGSACTPILEDPQNCGACGRACAAGETCVQGGCLGEGEYRIVLTWREGGFLYSHLWLPDQPGTRAHLGFEPWSRGNPDDQEPPYALIEMVPADVAHPLLYVPQATTVFRMLPGGRYVFAVESPPTQSQCHAQTETVGSSGAVVAIYEGSQAAPLRTYRAPSDPTPPWDTEVVRFWHVFDLEWTDAGVRIIDVDQSTADPYPYPDPEAPERRDQAKERSVPRRRQESRAPRGRRRGR